jgi:hypothetical protein
MDRIEPSKQDRHKDERPPECGTLIEIEIEIEDREEPLNFSIINRPAVGLIPLSSQKLNSWRSAMDSNHRYGLPHHTACIRGIAFENA